MGTVTEEMNVVIRARLACIEKEKNVQILFACESGSRVWGFSSQNSDYDVRFIYMHPRDKYLSIHEFRDVIEMPDDRATRTQDDLDFSGWDLRKALRLMNKFNPPIREWFMSPIIYRKNHLGAMLGSLAHGIYSPRACAYHYYHMARNNYREYLQGERVKLKKYLYVMRPLLAMIHIECKGFPPLDLDALLQAVGPSKEVWNAVDVVASQKRAGMELDDGPRIGVLNNWIEVELNRRNSGFDDLPDGESPREKLDDFFRRAWDEAT